MAQTARSPSPLNPASVVPAMVTIAPSGATRRTQLPSAMYTLPCGPTAAALGPSRPANTAGPPSPSLMSTLSWPATGTTVPSLDPTLLRRQSYAAGMEPAGSGRRVERPVRRQGAKDRAYAYVKDAVLTGALPGGELISEGEVAETLGMSRTPVREGFLKLEAEGLLRLYPQRGALVVPVSPAEVRAVMEARLVLEQFAVEKVIGQGPEASTALAGALDDLLGRQREHGEFARMAEFLDADRLFHTAMLDAAGNSFLGDLYRSLRDRQVRMIGESAVRDPRRVATIMAEHASIAAAVRAGDAAVALEAVRVHLTGTVSALGLTPSA